MKNIIILLMFTLLIVACAHTVSIPREHPEKLDAMPNCADCHDNELQAFSHTKPAFFKKHGAYAKQERLVCNSCHTESYCSDCHTNNDELKPSEKFPDAPLRNSPHRGDYLTLHRIDGKINAAPCAKCHGRQNNERCGTCHQ